MFIKSKICFTVFVIYEIIAISLLHFQRTCDAMFSAGFCDSDFKYFAGAIAVPLLAYLVWMWIREIVRARRRRKFINRAKQLLGDIATNVHEKLNDVSPRVLEQLIVTAIILGVQRYAAHHPNIHQTIGKIIGKSNGDTMYGYEYDMDTENVVASQQRAQRKSTRKSRAPQKKTNTRKK